MRKYLRLWGVVLPVLAGTVLILATPALGGASWYHAPVVHLLLVEGR